MGSFRSDFGFSILLSVILCSSSAYADDHIGKNALQFSPSISVGSEYRTNLYLQEGLLESSSGSILGQPLVSGTAILVNPVAKLKYSSSGVNTVLGINYRAKKYISSDTVDLSGLDRFKDVQLLGSLDLYPIKEFGFSLSNSLLSSGRETSADDTGSAYLQTIRNNFRGGLLIRPGSALEISAGGVYGIVDITDAQSSKDDPAVVLNNKQSLGWYADAQWKFLPRTSFFLNVSQENFDWQNKIVFSEESCEVVLTDDCAIASAVPNGSTLRSSLGLSGRFSERLLMKAAINYGTATYDTETLTEGITLGEELSTMVVDSAGANLEGLNGLGVSAGLTYMFSDTHSFNLAYDKDFMDVYFTNFSVYNQASLEYSVLIMKRVKWDTNFRYRIDSYEGSVTRKDSRLSINSSVNILLQKRASLRLGGGWSQLASSPEFYDIEYDDFRVHGGLVLGY
jgi:hypothetical protein